MAAPHVSGALAVLRSAGLAPAAAVQRLLDTAVDLGDPGPDVVFGAGRIDLAAAVAGTAVPASPTSEAPPAAELPTGEAVQPVPDDGGDDGVPVLPATAAGLLVLATGAAAAQLLRRPG
jgi:subtilisin family serine protease